MTRTPAPLRTTTVHGALGETFFDSVDAAVFPRHILRYRNQRWAERVGLGDLSPQDWIAHFGAFTPLPGSFQRPLALRYHGHQFRAYNSELGDGRGFLFAQLYDLEDGRLLDLGTKGSGRTPWSRGGDGRLTLKGGVREILATEMLEALGVCTSKSFSLVETGEELKRGDEPSPTRSAVLVRLSHSHIRIGTFQRLAYFEDISGLHSLRDHTITHYMPELADEPEAGRTAAFMARVVQNVARMGAQWIAAGFVHGVLNSDNINVTGESFDYGPWRFLPRYDPMFTAAYFDETRLYAFGRQPDALAWNLTRLAECLLPIGQLEPIEKALNTFWPTFQEALAQAMLGRLGLHPVDGPTDAGLVTKIFEFLGQSGVGYEQFLFDWRGGAAGAERVGKSPAASYYTAEAFMPLAEAFKAFTPKAELGLEHRYFSRASPRTMLIEEVEAIWAPIAERDDWSALETALAEIETLRQAYAGDAR